MALAALVLTLATPVCFDAEPVNDRILRIAEAFDLLSIHVTVIAENSRAPKACGTELESLLAQSLACTSLKYILDGRILILDKGPPCEDCCPLRLPQADWR